MAVTKKQIEDLYEQIITLMDEVDTPHEGMELDRIASMISHTKHMRKSGKELRDAVREGKTQDLQNNHQERYFAARLMARERIMNSETRKRNAS